MDANEKDKRRYLMKRGIVLAALIFLITSPLPSSAAPPPPPPDQLYHITIMLNDIQTRATFMFNDIEEFASINQTHRILLKQKHMETYLKQLNRSKDNAYIIEKIKSKQKEVDDLLPHIQARHTYEIRNNHRVLGDLINSTTMPQQSRQGLQNAYNNSMKTMEVMEQFETKENRGKK